MGKVEGTIKCVLGGDCVDQRDVSKTVNGSQSARGRVLLSLSVAADCSAPTLLTSLSTTCEYGHLDIEDVTWDTLYLTVVKADWKKYWQGKIHCWRVSPSPNITCPHIQLRRGEIVGATKWFTLQFVFNNESFIISPNSSLLCKFSLIYLDFHQLNAVGPWDGLVQSSTTICFIY